MIRTHTLLLLSLLLSIHAIAKPQQRTPQQTPEVKGKVYSSTNTAIANTSIFLLTAKTKAIIKTGITDAEGTYILKNVPKGEFIIQATSVGYSSANSDPFVIAAANLELPTLVLSESSNLIGEVAVEGRVPLVQQRDGKLVLNVENSTLAAGNNALEVIQRAPGVSMDKDDNLQLMGQSGVNVTIDGRQTYMSGEQLASFLKAMDGSQIKSVEVGTVRSARDDAEGAVGTINIVLKKNKLEGFNGSFLASVGQGKHFRGNSSLSLNYKKNNTTLFGSYAYADNKRESDLGIERLIPSDTEPRFFDQQSTIIDHTKSHTYKMGIEQRTSEKNVMMLQYNGMIDNEDSRNLSLTNIGPKQHSIDSILNSTSISHRPLRRHSVNFNNEYSIDSLGSKLTFDLDWSTFRNDGQDDYEYRTSLPNGNLLYDPEIEQSRLPIKIDIFAAKVDYTRMLGLGKLEAGAKYSRVKSDNNMQFTQFVEGAWQEYEGRSNHFLYTEQIAAAYADYSRAFGKLSMKLGLRGEYTFSDGNSLTLGKRIKKDYPDLFPSANIGYTINENNVVSLSYARKVSRPNYRYLNPFEYYIDKFTSQRGNPDIKPQYTDGFTLNYTLYKMFNLTLGSDITKDAVVESLGQDAETGKAWITRDNLGKTVTAYFNVNAPAQIGKIWTMNNNLTTIYMHFNGPIAGSHVNVGSTFFQGRSTNNFRISKAWSAEASVNYNSPFLYNVYKIHARWDAEIGTSYNFKDKRSSLKLAMTDVFRTRHNNVSTDFAEFNSMIRQYHDNQSVRLTFTYKFGNLKQQLRRISTDSDEKARAQ